MTSSYCVSYRRLAINNFTDSHKFNDVYCVDDNGTVTHILFTLMLANNIELEYKFYVLRISISLPIFGQKFSFKLVNFSEQVQEYKSGCFLMNRVYYNGSLQV